MTPLPSTRLMSIPVLITSAINVSAAKTVLTDPNVRLCLTLKCINKWCSTPGVSHVIVCDGSGFDLRPHLNKIVSTKSGISCEIISFKNDVVGVKAKGKGYGEGEIINYALGHSKFLNGASHFAKCTGKLWVENFATCLSGFNQLASFDFYGNFKPIMIDTRFYIVEKEFYISKLAALHNYVDDDNGYYLEHAFRDGLAILKLSDYVMYPTPRISGVSGSMGVHFETNRFKAALRDVRSQLVKLVT